MIAYFDAGGIDTPDRTASRGRAPICRSATIPSLSLVGTPYAQACGAKDPLDLSPGGPGLLTSSDGTVALVAALMTDDSTQVAEAAAATIRSIVPGPAGDKTGCTPTSPARSASRPTAARRSRASTRRCCW